MDLHAQLIRWNAEVKHQNQTGHSYPSDEYLVPPVSGSHKPKGRFRPRAARADTNPHKGRYLSVAVGTRKTAAFKPGQANKYPACCHHRALCAGVRRQVSHLQPA
jgi:hypothetical protein